MAKCWTCGSPVSGYQFKCSSCQNLTEIKNLQHKLESKGDKISDRLDYLAQLQEEELRSISNSISTGFSHLASAIEWGLSLLSWQYQQQTKALLDINHTLKTPAETKANELRNIAEKLLARGVLDESEKYFLMALDSYPLDYRTYVGLAYTYLLMNNFDNAKVFLEKSLPHAPKQEIDYRSYSMRLIGRIHTCNEDYNSAASLLSKAVELSPKYYEAHYEYAQYCAQLHDKENCLSALRLAISGKDSYYYSAHVERNFDPLRDLVTNLLDTIINQALKNAKSAIFEAENNINDANEPIILAEEALIKARYARTLESSNVLEKAKALLNDARENIMSGDYVAILDAASFANEAYNLAIKANKMAHNEKQRYEEMRSARVARAWRSVPTAFIGYPLWFGAICAFSGCAISKFIFDSSILSGIIGGFIVGAVVGIVFGIFLVLSELGFFDS